MIELVPYMLMLVLGAPGQPGEVTIERVNRLYASEAECKAAGIDRMAGSDRITAWQCMAVPDRKEFDRLFERLEREQRAARRRGGE